MSIFQKIFGTSKNPEDDFVITITDKLIKVEHPRRETEQILWKDINKIKLIRKSRFSYIKIINAFFNKLNKFNYLFNYLSSMWFKFIGYFLTSKKLLFIFYGPI